MITQERGSMTATPAAAVLTATLARTPQARTYLMCPPEYFSVQYAINPWMTLGQPVDGALATRQWQGLRDAFRSLGHAVRCIGPVAGLPDKALLAHGATAIGGTAIRARFPHPEPD